MSFQSWRLVFFELSKTKQQQQYKILYFKSNMKNRILKKSLGVEYSLKTALYEIIEQKNASNLAGWKLLCQCLVILLSSLFSTGFMDKLYIIAFA